MKNQINYSGFNANVNYTILRSRCKKKISIFLKTQATLPILTGVVRLCNLDFDDVWFWIILSR